MSARSRPDVLERDSVETLYGSEFIRFRKKKEYSLENHKSFWCFCFDIFFQRHRTIVAVLSEWEHTWATASRIVEYKRVNNYRTMTSGEWVTLPVRASLVAWTVEVTRWSPLIIDNFALNTSLTRLVEQHFLTAHFEASKYFTFSFSVYGVGELWGAERRSSLYHANVALEFADCKTSNEPNKGFLDNRKRGRALIWLSAR